jgi:O-antigen/teichoic acid export membrane protein
VLIILLMSAHNRVDAFLLERLHSDGPQQAGIYAAAYRLLDAGNVAGYLMASFLLPFLSRNQQNRMLLQKVILLSRHGLLFVAVVVMAFVIVFAPWLQQVLYHTTDAYSSMVMRLCLAALPAYYLVHIYGSALTATANFKLFIQVLLLAAVLNALLNIWLIPLYGAMGCCIAALVTQYGCGILLWATASRRLSVSLSAGTAVLYPVTALLLCFCFYFLQKLAGNVWIILSSIAALIIVLLVLQRNVIRKVFLSFSK